MKNLVVLKDDYEFLKASLPQYKNSAAFSRESIESLEIELEKARVVERNEFPDDVVRIDSMVMIMDISSGKEMQLRLVLPKDEDPKKKNISVMAPVGTALIGFRKGDVVKWKVPAGEKKFRIKDVKNEVN